MSLIERLFVFVSSSKKYPFLAAISSGLYPLLYYYNSNFNIANSWYQLLCFLLFFLLIPSIVFYLLNLLFINYKILLPDHKFLIPVLNICWFTVLIVISTSGLQKKILVISSLAAFCLP